MPTLEEYREKLKFSDQEELFDFTLPPEYQCPLIDSFLKDVAIVRAHLEKAKHEVWVAGKNNVSDEIDFNKRAIHELDVVMDSYLGQIEEGFEYLRRSFETFRKSHKEWKDLAEEIFNTHKNNVKFLDVNIQNVIKEKDSRN